MRKIENVKSFPGVARGRIIHSVTESLKYFLISLFGNINDETTVEAAESEFAGYNHRKYCVAFPLARVAILVALKSLGLKPGDKILMPCLTIKPILDVVVSLKLQPVYIDYDEDTCFFDLNQLETIDTDIKAVLATPLFGIAPDMNKLLDFCNRSGAKLIEDFSQALNCEYDGRRIGSFGKISIYSASSIKTLDSLGGGYFLTDDHDLYKAAKQFQNNLSPPSRLLIFRRAALNLIRNVATTPFGFNFITRYYLAAQSRFSPEGELRQTGTREVTPLNELPMNWFVKYSALQAKISLKWLPHITDIDEKRIQCAESYKAGFPEGLVPAGEPLGKNVYWQFPIKASRERIKALRRQLRLRGIDTSITSLSLISSIETYPGARSNLRVAEQIHSQYLFVPCNSKLSKRDRMRVLSSINSCDY